MIPIISLNETSLAVSQLHIIMQLLQLPVNQKEKAAKRAGAATQKIIRAWQKQQQLPIPQQLLIDTATATALAKVLKGMGYVERSLQSTISGKVNKASGDPVAKIKLLAFDLDLIGVGLYKDIKFTKQLLATTAGFEYLGEATSGEKGFYEFSYYDWMFAKSERKRADVAVFAVKGDKIIGHSRLVQNAGKYVRDVNINLAEVKRTKGEYKVIYKAVLTFLKESKMNLKDLSQSQDYIPFIGGELDIAVEKVRHLLEAHTLNDSTQENLEPELLYGLGRQKLTLDLGRLHGTSLQVLQSALQRAIDEKDIDKFSQDTLDAFIETLYTIAAKKVLEPQGNTPNIADELLKLSLKKKEDRVLFAKLKTQYTGVDENDFWDNHLPKNSNFDAKTILDLRKDQEIFALTGFYLPMTKEIKKANPKGPTTLVKWDAKKLLSIVKKVNAPAHIKGKDKSEKVKNYAKVLEKTINTKFTHEAVKHKISKQKILFSNPDITSNITKFFNAEKDFDIKTSNINKYKDKLFGIIGTDKKLQKRVLAETQELQRMVRLNPDTSKIPVMKKNGLTNAMVILEYPKKSFVANYGKELGGKEYALEMYHRAETRSVTLDRVITGTRATVNKYVPEILIGREERERLLEGVEDRFPGYSEAFNVSLCECRHCNSVYSPAAYFVDLMRYLERGVKKEGKSPSDIFRKRRPDLFHLPLTCENSNTLIPYIDLANEVMENYIHYTKNTGLNFDNYASEDTGDLTPEELRAQPQFVKKDTYFTLSEAISPFTMPYHLPLETLRLYSKQLGTSWFEILKTIQNQPVSSSIQNYLRATFLGLTKKDFEILTAKNFNDTTVSFDVKALYNVTSLSDLASVPTFLKQTGLQYVELVQLIKTNYINPKLYKIPYLDFLFLYRETDGSGAETRFSVNEIYGFLNDISEGGAIPSEISRALIKSDISQADFSSWVFENFNDIKGILTLYEPDSECDLNTTKIQTIRKIYESSAGTITEAVWHKLLRFIRLWHKTRWSLEDFDAIVSSLTMGTFNPVFLKTFSYARQFIDATGITPKKAAVLWGDFNCRVEGNLYAKLFLNRSVEINEIFIPKPSSDLFDGLDNTHNLLKYHPDLQAAFKVTEDDLNLIYEYDSTISETETISVAHISTLYRYLLFAELCKISVTNLISYARLFELELFSEPFSSLESYEQIKKIKEIDFAIEDLAYIFKSAEIDSHSIALLDDGLIENMILLFNEYVAIDEQVSDASERLNHKKLFTYNTLADYLELSLEVVELLMESSIDGFVTTIGSIVFDASEEVIDVTFLLDETITTSPKSIMTGLHRANITIDRFQLDASEVVYLIDHSGDFGGLDIKNPNMTTWWRLYDYASLKESLPDTEKSLIDIFEYVNSGTTATIEQLKMLITEVTHWNTAGISYLVDEIYSDLDLFKNEKILVQMQNPIQLANTMGITVASLYSLERGEGVELDSVDTFNDFWECAQKLKRLLKVKYSHSTWTSVATKLNDTLREQRRDALVAYLLQMEVIRNHELEIGDANGLYEFFLLDVQMSACMETSRIVQANAAIQQFANRTHLNLEKNVLVEALDRYRWSWMKQYRVWEAKMRVWYENETLLNPEWRLDKSPFFKELESHLTQNDITDRTAEEALRGYLKSMDEVSNLNVAGMYEETVESGNLKIVHVFGHTNNTPYIYYYRTYNQYGKWSAWEKVDAAIQAVSYSDADTGDGEKKTGVHLIPVVWKNRLILFWPEFLEKSEPVSNNDKTYKQLADGAATIASQQPKKYWEVRLAWSEYYDGKWTAKQVSEEFFKSWIPNFNNRYANSQAEISFASEVDRGFLNIYMTVFNSNHYSEKIHFKLLEGPYYSEHSTFSLVNLTDSFQVSRKRQKLFAARPYEEFHSLLIEKYICRTPLGYYRNEQLLDTYKYNFTKTNILNEALTIGGVSYLASNGHQLLFPNQLKYSDDPVSYPFFYSVNRKNYFVKQIWVYYEIIVAEGLGEGHWGSGSGFDIVEPMQLPVLSFSTFHHPFVSDFISNLNKNGIGTNDLNKPGLMESDTLVTTEDGKSYDDGGSYFEEAFNPNRFTVYKPDDLDDSSKTYYKETIDFDPYGSNSYLNWELFYHAPLYIATQLSKNGKYQEAVKWFHYIFDPTTDSPVETGTGVNEVARFFKVKPFKTTPTASFEEFITGLSANAADSPENKIIEEWKNNAFDPHLVASSFPVNYMKHVILAYVENLVNWGDNLFRRFTRENVYEAIQLYVIAGHILGPKPQFIPERGVVKRETYDSISSKLNDLSNAYVSLENNLPYSSDSVSMGTGDGTSSLLGMGSAFYFCIPPNEKLMKYWDIVEDRLYKIRHCKDINGVARRLALFAPPIDPAALIKARSAGLDLEDILQGLYAPNPHYRFVYLLQKANEFCNDVKALGNALLSAIEKQEGEALSQIRATHEIEMLGMVQKIKERQILDTRMAQELLEKQRETAIFRFNYYNETLLGNESVEIPSVIDLELDLDENSQIILNPDIQEVVPDVNVALVDTDEEGIKLIGKEKEEINKREQSNFMTNLASRISAIASPLNLIPSFSVEAEPFGVGGSISFGGQNLSAAVQSHVNVLQIIAAIRGQEAAKASTTASYIRREQDWTLQANLAAKEIQQLERQILSAGIRVQIAEKDLANHKRQIENAETIENYIKNKFTNKELYQWMKEQLVSVHKESYDLAFQLAKQAEMAFEFEKRIDSSESTYINYGYYDNLKNGLLSGEKLQLALRQLELAYLEKNTREFELTKHVSLQLLNPTALLMLRETGKCGFELFEELFDLDFPGHFNRRIKSVSISIPCIAGPYTSIACTVRIGANIIRFKPEIDSGGYDVRDSEAIFSTQNIPKSSIATSSGQNDGGMYELNFRDERYLPFEGAGVIGNWNLELFHKIDDDYGKHLRQFDYNTISDVIMHIKYTAVEEQGTFKNEVIKNLDTFFGPAGKNKTLKAFNLKHDFPSEWHKLQTAESGTGENLLKFVLRPEHFPYRDKFKELVINGITLVADCSESGNYTVSLTTPTTTINLELRANTLGILHSETLSLLSIPIELNISNEIDWSLNIVKSDGSSLNENELREMYLILEYSWHE